ncbi:MAG: glycoside hydrolase family 3 protein [Treponema sp.]|nr:glycoside hydrolase family 3 protein [Treponema sp.]
MSVKRLIFLNLALIALLLSACNREIRNIEIQIDEPAPVIDIHRIRAAEIVSSMSDSLLTAQLMISGIDGNSSLSPGNREMFSEIPAGGIILFRYNLNTDNDSIRSLISEAAQFIADETGVPPFITVDHEGGVVNRFRSGIATLPAASSYWELSSKIGILNTLAQIETDSFNAGCEIAGLGINLNFAPVAEYLIDENRVFLEKRSYGADPYFTMLGASAFIKGMERSGVLCVAKHFPGSAGKDPHFSASVLDFDRESVDRLVMPFASLIKDGARGVMAAHTKIPLIDDEIASLSSAVMNDWLRGELGFNGIIVSDDFTMAAAGSIKVEEAAVRSVVAGSDMILVWPSHLKDTHAEFIKALEDGSLTRDRLAESAQRIIYEKLKMGLLE